MELASSGGVRRLVVSGVLAAFAIALAPAPANAWLQRVSGSRFLVNDEAVAIAIDSRGDVLVVAVSIPDPGPCRVAATKRDGKSGRVIWRQPLGRCLYGTAAAVAVDAAGDVVVGLPGFVLVKLEARTGEVLWRSEPGPDVRWSAGSVNGIAIDTVGDVIAAGDGVFNPFDDEDHDFAVVKVRRATGAKVWHVSINGELPPCPPDDYCDDDVYPFDLAAAVALDAAGRVVVAGQWEHHRYGGFLVLSLDGGTGTELWRHTSPGGAVALLATPDGVYAGGHAADGAVVVRLDPATGRERWRRELDPDVAGGWVGALAAHRSGDVMVAGSVPRRDVAEPFVARLRSSHGEVAWQRALPNPTPHGRVQALRLAAGRDDGVAVLASVAAPATDSERVSVSAAVALLAAGRGDVVWQTPVAGSDGGEGRGWALSARIDGDLVVGGGARNVQTQLDAMVARLRAGDGTVAWRIDENGRPAGEDAAAAVAVDAAGNAIVVGSVQNAGTGADLAVVKLAHGTGAELWRREVDGIGPFGSSVDSAADVALAPDDGLVVAGQVGDAAAVVTLDGSTGGERWRTALPYASISTLSHDAYGDVVALAHRRYADPATTVVKLDGATGADRWHRPIDLGPRRLSATPSMTVTLDGTVVTASYGYDDTTRRFDGVLIAFAADGTERWRRVIPDAQTRIVATDAAGRVVVGVTLHADSPDSSVAVALLEAATGRELLRAVVTTSAMRPAAATLLASDGSSGVLVGGFAGVDAFVARVDADGGVAWTRVVDVGDRRLGGRHVASVRGLAVRPLAGVVLGFTLFSDDRAFDWGLAGLSLRSGAVRWLRRVDGDESPSSDLGDFDTLSDLAMTPRGEAVAVGTTDWIASTSDLTVLAVRARSGRERRPPAADRGVGRPDLR